MLDVVTPQYGVGAIACWFFALLSTVVTWKINPKTLSKDTINNDLILSLSLPAISSIYVLYELSPFSKGTNLAATKDGTTGGASTAITSPLAVCELFSKIALIASIVAFRKRFNYRALATAFVGLLSFSAEIACFVDTLDTTPTAADLAKHIALKTFWEFFYVYSFSTTIYVAFKYALVVIPLKQQKKQSSNGHEKSIFVYKIQLFSRQTKDTAVSLFIRVVLISLAVAATGFPGMKQFGMVDNALFRVFVPKHGDFSSIQDTSQIILFVVGLSIFLGGIWETLKIRKDEAAAATASFIKQLESRDAVERSRNPRSAEINELISKKLSEKVRQSGDGNDLAMDQE